MNVKAVVCIVTAALKTVNDISEPTYLHTWSVGCNSMAQAVVLWQDCRLWSGMGCRGVGRIRVFGLKKEVTGN
jgi:hypothetical protein